METILDDLEKIQNIDKMNMLSFCVQAPEHYNEAAKNAKRLGYTYSKPNNIIIGGLGGSAIGGDLLKDWTENKIACPIEVCRDYSLPRYANKKTLVFLVSYSGETEETLSLLLDALNHKCKIVCISSGGELLKNAQKIGLSHLQVPIGMPPRAAISYLFLPIAQNLEDNGLISGFSEELAEAIKILERVKTENIPEKTFNKNFSKKLAYNIFNTIPIIYGWGIFRAVARRYKQQFNENSKTPARWDVLPEMKHNEIVSWETSKFSHLFSVLFLRSNDESKEIQLRMLHIKEQIRKSTKRIFEIEVMGEKKLSKMVSSILLGDFTSIYLAILRGIDPTPIKTIDHLKGKNENIGTKNRIIAKLREIA